MTSESMGLGTLIALAVASLLALASSGRRLLLAPALAATMVGLAWWSPQPSALDLGPFATVVPTLCLVVLAHRVGRALRRPLFGLPLSILVLAAAGTVVLAPIFVAGLGERWPSVFGALAGRESLLWVLGLAIILPDGMPASDRLESRRAGDEPLAGLLALMGLASVHVVAGLDPASRSELAAGAGGAADDLWPTPQIAAVITALAVGAATGWILGQIRQRLDGELRARLALIAGALVPAAIAEWLHPGTAPLAALASGALDRRSEPHPEADPRPESMGGLAAWALPLGLVAAIGGFAWHRVGPEPRHLALGAALWALALLVRTLVLLTIAGAYRAVRPERVRWARILAGAILTAPGALALAWTLALLPRSSELAGAQLGALLGAITLALLVEGTAAPWLRRRAGRSEADETWELAHARVRALRVAEDALRHADERGELQGLSQSSREALSRALEQSRLRSELEAEDLLHQHSHLRQREAESVTARITRQVLHSLEQDVHEGALRAATLEALRLEIVRWLRPSDAARAARPAPLADSSDSTTDAAISPAPHGGDTP